LRFKVRDLEFRVKGARFRTLGFRVRGLGFLRYIVRVADLGLRVEG
jgi:hypothetical protein